MRKTVLFAKNFMLRRELSGIMDFARAHGWRLEMPQMYGLSRHVRAWRGEGLLTDTARHTGVLRRAGVKIVGLSLEPELVENAGAVVAPDNERIGVVGAEYFLARGFRRFAVFADCYGRDRAFAERVAQDGFAARRLAMPRFFRSERALERLAGDLKSLPAPCGVFCNNDWEAISALNAAEAAGLRVPEDLALVGVGNEEQVCAATTPSISSVDTRLYARGYRAARELDRLMEGGAPREAPVLVGPGHVVERGSSEFFAVDDPRLGEVVAYLRSRLARPLRVGALARRFNVSASKLFRMFRDGLGMSPKDFLTELRLTAARARLADTDDAVSAVAESCGFPSSAALFDLFRRRHGQTPTQWRRAFLKPAETCEKTAEGEENT